MARIKTRETGEGSIGRIGSIIMHKEALESIRRHQNWDYHTYMSWSVIIRLMGSSSSQKQKNVFFDITIDGQPAGRIEFELNDRIVPKTCQNFRQLATHAKGFGYKGSIFHRVIEGFVAQGGDFQNDNGSGGKSIYGTTFKDENFKLKHDQPYLLSMANQGPNTNNSQFFITFGVLSALDGKHVMFGRVVGGVEVVKLIERKANGNEKPLKPIAI